MRFASLYEITSSSRAIKEDSPRSNAELEALLALAAAGQMGPMQANMMGMNVRMGQNQNQGQMMGRAVQGANPGSNITDAFHRKDCQVPFNIPGMGPVDTGQPSGARNNNAAFKAGLHIGAGNKPSLMGGGMQGGMQQGRMMGGMQMGGMNQRGGRMMGGQMGPGPGGMFQGMGFGSEDDASFGPGMGPGGMQGGQQGGRMMGGQQRGGMMGGGMLAQGVGAARGTNCGDMVRQINVMVKSKQGQFMTIRGLIDSGAGVALMDPKVGQMLGFGQGDAARTIQAMGEGGQCNACPLINITVMIPPSTTPLDMQAVLFADGQGDVFTPFPTCDLTMRVNIDIDSAGHTITAQDNNMSMRYDCMGMGMMQMGRMQMMRGMQMQQGMMQMGRMMGPGMQMQMMGGR